MKRVRFERCVLFLRNDLEYSGPRSFVSLTGPFNRIWKRIAGKTEREEARTSLKGGTRCREDCAQFCAHHGTLPSMTECVAASLERLAGQGICDTPSQFVAISVSF
jgi:hypothetical protein